MHLSVKAFILLIFFAGVYCLEKEQDLLDGSNLLATEARKRKDHYFLHPYHGWHILTWVYWIKVKLVVVAFIAYTTFIWALRYMGDYYNKCSHSGHHVYYDHGHYRSLSHLVDMPKTIKASAQRRKIRSVIHI